MDKDYHLHAASFASEVQDLHRAMSNGKTEDAAHIVGRIGAIRNLQGPELRYQQLLLREYGAEQFDSLGIPLNLYDTPISIPGVYQAGDLFIGVRAGNCIAKDNKINRVGYLVLRSHADLLKMRNFGRKSLNEVVLALEELHPRLGIDMDMSYIHPDDLERAKELAHTRDGSGSTPYQKLSRARFYGDLARVHPALHKKNLELLTR